MSFLPEFFFPHFRNYTKKWHLGEEAAPHGMLDVEILCSGCQTGLAWRSTFQTMLSTNFFIAFCAPLCFPCLNLRSNLGMYACGPCQFLHFVLALPL